MRKIVLFVFAVCLGGGVSAQSLKDILKKVANKDSSTTATANMKAIAGALAGTGSLSTDEIGAALKEALSKGVTSGTSKLSAADGFFKNAAVKILLPPEAAKIESTLKGIGMGKLVDDAVLSMNRAAEDASKSAAPVFMTAIKNMTIKDALTILNGSDTSATAYLRTSTSDSLVAAFKPIIEQSLNKVNATRYWSTMMTAYNKIPLVKKINPDLSQFVTARTVSGMFYQIGQEETLIRKDPAARTTELLKKVFGK